MTKFNSFARMQTQRQVLFYLFALTIVIIIFPKTIIAQSNSEFKSKYLAQTNSQTTLQNQKSVWQAIWELFRRRPEPSLASRQLVCPITPGLLESPNIIWSDRPMFIWQGEVSQLSIYLYDSFNPAREQQLLWSQTFTPQSSTSNFYHLAYTGEALLPGQSYDWEIVISSNRRDRYTFQVMDLAQRDRISSELLALENQLATKEVSKEEIALQKANYFAQKSLWSDALQQIYSISNPSNDFMSNAHNILNYLCED